MYLRKCRRKVGGEHKDYWQLVECYRTARGPRQRIVAYLGNVEAAVREGVAQAARGVRTHQPQLEETEAPEWVEVDAKRLRVERVREFGGPWLGLQVMEKLGLGAFLHSVLLTGREEISWATTAQVLILGRLCDPSSELALAERVYARTALGDLLGVPLEKVNEDRLYRALDALLPHKAALERHLKEQLGELLALEYDLLLYDVTSTYLPGAGGRESPGAAGLLAGSWVRLQAGLPCAGGGARGGTLGLPSLRRRPQRCDDGRGDRGVHRGAVWGGGSHLGDGSRDGERGERGVSARRRPALYSGDAQEQPAPL